MARKKTYNIFISYRRTAYDTAKLIAEKLRHAGYHVFFDVDTLTSGKFNEQLLEVISGCKDFILVLPEKALDRCVDENDWIRREVTCAIEQKKNIIPVMLDGFEWPKEMPKGIEDLPNYQAISAVNHEYFDMAIDRLKGYLISTPDIPVKRWLQKAGIVLGVLLAFIGVGFGILNHIANVTCEEIATQQTKVMGAVEAIADFRQELSEQSTSFFTAIDKSMDEEEQNELENELISSLTRIEKDIRTYKKNVPAPDFSMQGTESYVLAYYGVKKEEMKAFSAYYMSLYDDIEDVIAMLKEMAETHNYKTEYKDVVILDLTCMTYAINAFYYGYLGSLSLLPKDARNFHYELSKKWTHFPNGTPLDLSQEEYEQFEAYEINRLQDEIDRYGAQVNYEERRLNELEKQIDDLMDVVESQTSLSSQ